MSEKGAIVSSGCQYSLPCFRYQDVQGGSSSKTTMHNSDEAKSTQEKGAADNVFIKAEYEQVCFFSLDDQGNIFISLDVVIWR